VSEENVRLVRRWFEGLRVGELLPEICDPGIEIRNWKESPILGPYNGHQGLDQWWNDLQEAFEDVHLELVDAVDIGGDRVLTKQRIVGRFRLTKIDVDYLWGSVVTIKDGMIASAVGYQTPAQAKRAAGLRTG
jgi:hypothetical protein